MAFDSAIPPIWLHPEDPIAAATGFLTGKFSLTDDRQREHQEEARREQKTRPR